MLFVSTETIRMRKMLRHDELKSEVLGGGEGGGSGSMVVFFLTGGKSALGWCGANVRDSCDEEGSDIVKIISS
jgi:hypothetical protein